MQHVSLSRRPYRPDRGANQGQAFLGRLTLAQARLHEICGPARHSLAMMVAGTMRGPVLWVMPDWATARPYGPGMVRFVDPGRVTFVSAQRAEDILWTLEEGLRSGVVPLVIGDLPAPCGLTPVRRLHLAAETGAREGRLAPLGLILTPDGAAPGVESRWHMAPDHHGREGAAGQETWRLTRQRARTAPERSWQVCARGSGFDLAPARTT